MPFDYYSDNRGTPWIVESGTASLIYEFDAWGNILDMDGETYLDALNPFGFTGLSKDGVTGLYSAQKRNYDPLSGRWISMDPYWNPSNMIYSSESSEMPSVSSVMQSSNLYGYVMGNPLIYVDMRGLSAGQRFKTEDDAVKNWVWDNRAKSKYLRIEFGSVIYRGIDEERKEYYVYTESVVGEFHSIDLNEPFSWAPKGTTVVATIHSHPNSYAFSNADKKNSVITDTTCYLVTPDGSVRQYAKDI